MRAQIHIALRRLGHDVAVFAPHARGARQVIVDRQVGHEAFDLGALVTARLNALEAEGADAEQARRAMSDRLRALSWAAGQLSDRLSLRHFSHITLDAQALAT